MCYLRKFELLNIFTSNVVLNCCPNYYYFKNYDDYYYNYFIIRSSSIIIRPTWKDQSTFHSENSFARKDI